MDLAEKLEILADSAKYDVACTSSGVDRPGRHGSLGSCAAAGICHAFTPDGRCVSLLKVLYSNVSSYDCSDCVNRRTNDRPRATFTPAYDEMVIKGEDLDHLYIAGKVVETKAKW